MNSIYFNNLIICWCTPVNSCIANGLSQTREIKTKITLLKCVSIVDHFGKELLSLKEIKTGEISPWLITACTVYSCSDLEWVFAEQEWF